MNLLTVPPKKTNRMPEADPAKGRSSKARSLLRRNAHMLASLPSVQEVVFIEPGSRFCQISRQGHPSRELVEGTMDRLGDDLEWDAIDFGHHRRYAEPELRQELQQAGNLLRPPFGQCLVAIAQAAS